MSLNDWTKKGAVDVEIVRDGAYSGIWFVHCRQGNVDYELTQSANDKPSSAKIEAVIKFASTTETLEYGLYVCNSESGRYRAVFKITPDSTVIELYKTTGDTDTPMATTTLDALPPDTYVKISLLACDVQGKKKLVVAIDDNPQITVYDDSPLGGGSVGFFANAPANNVQFIDDIWVYY